MHVDYFFLFLYVSHYLPCLEGKSLRSLRDFSRVFQIFQAKFVNFSKISKDHLDFKDFLGFLAKSVRDFFLALPETIIIDLIA